MIVMAKNAIVLKHSKRVGVSLILALFMLAIGLNIQFANAQSIEFIL